jgi:hypothetical protein
MISVAEESPADSEATLPCPGDGETPSSGSRDGRPAVAAEALAPAPAVEVPAPAPAVDDAAAADAAKEAAAAAKWGDAADVFGGFDG